MSDYRVFFLPVLLASVFAGSTTAMDLTVSAPNSQTHIYTHIHTPIPEPAPLFAELEKSYQTAGVCFIGFGDCGGNTDFGRSDEGFTLPDCASIGYPLTSCTPPQVLSAAAVRAKSLTRTAFALMTPLMENASVTPAPVMITLMKKQPKKVMKLTAPHVTVAVQKNTNDATQVVRDIWFATAGRKSALPAARAERLNSLQPVRNVAPTNVRWTNVRTAPSALWKTVRANIARRAAQPAWPTLKITGATALCGTGFRSRQAARQRRINQRTEEKDYV